MDIVENVYGFSNSSGFQYKFCDTVDEVDIIYSDESLTSGTVHFLTRNTGSFNHASCQSNCAGIQILNVSNAFETIVNDIEFKVDKDMGYITVYVVPKDKIVSTTCTSSSLCD